MFIRFKVCQSQGRVTKNDLIARNIRVKYENAVAHCQEVISKVKV